MRNNPFFTNLAVVLGLIVIVAVVITSPPLTRGGQTTPPELQIDVREFDDPLAVIDALHESLANIELFHALVTESYRRLDDDLAAVVVRADGDLEKLAAIPYYENPFTNRDWELLTFFPNRLAEITLLLHQLEVIVLESDRPKTKEQETFVRLQQARQRLEEASRYMYID